jgi:serine/threonine protein phosphatase PrpC
MVNVGDSRTYQYTQSKGLCRVTRDHSTVERFVEHGVITDEERYTHKRRNEIYRYLGGGEEIEVDTFTIALHATDRLLLCSDGLWEMVRDHELALLLSSSEEPSTITEQLLQTALTHGGHDNITALVITIPNC